MNDDFWGRFREPPRPEFARSLYARLEQPRRPLRAARSARPRDSAALVTLGLSLLVALVVFVGLPTNSPRRFTRPADEALAAGGHQTLLFVAYEAQTHESMRLIANCASCPRDLFVRKLVFSHHRSQ